MSVDAKGLAHADSERTQGVHRRAGRSVGVSRVLSGKRRPPLSSSLWEGVSACSEF